jgi:hypothetical protein
MMAGAFMNAANFAGGAMIESQRPQSQVLRRPDAQGNTMTAYNVRG